MVVAGGFGTSGTGMGPQEHRQAARVDRRAARRFPGQISSLKESREEGGEWLILAVSRGSGAPLSTLSGALHCCSGPSYLQALDLRRQSISTALIGAAL